MIPVRVCCVGWQDSLEILPSLSSPKSIECRKAIRPLLHPADLVLMREAAQRQARNREAMHHVVSGYRLLVLVEIRYHLPLSREQGNLLFEVVTERCERSSMMLTSNLTFGSWDEAFGGDSVLTTAMFDGVLHRATIVTINGEGHRLKDKRMASYRNSPNSPKNNYRAAVDGRENYRRAGQFYFDDSTGSTDQNSTDVDIVAPVLTN